MLKMFVKFTKGRTSQPIRGSKGKKSAVYTAQLIEEKFI